MHRYFLHLGYDGSQYRGWQWQPNVTSVQETIQNALKKIFKEDITVYGCGRTDAQVHASQYIAHIKLSQEPDFDFKFRFNKNLPDSIVIYDIISVTNDRHARFDAVARSYDYFVHTEKYPVLSKYSSYYPDLRLDINLMQSAAGLLPYYKDFRAFCKQSDTHNHTFCELSAAKIFSNKEKTRVRLSITSNRFLREMIRITMAYLIQVGTGELSLPDFEDLLINPSDMDNKKAAFPQGLYLSKVEYPYIDFAPKSDFASFLMVGLE